MRFTVSTILALSAFAIAAPTSSVETRQVEWHAVGEIYTGGGCTAQSLVYADPIWGPANRCQKLDRNDQIGPILSYKAVSVDAGCTVSLFYDAACSQPSNGFTAGVNGCVQGNSPFESAIVRCPV